jgi:hypothetical protein
VAAFQFDLKKYSSQMFETTKFVDVFWNECTRMVLNPVVVKFVHAELVHPVVLPAALLLTDRFRM